MTDEQLYQHLKKTGIKTAKMITAKEYVVLDAEGKGYSLLSSFLDKFSVNYNPKNGKYKVKKKGMIS